VERRVVDEEDEEDEEGGAVAAAVSLRTKNELSEPDIVIPSIAEVGPDEQLEKVGEIMNIVNNVVVVKGEASSTHRASEHALDSETLLVYEDRKVLGYVSGALPLLVLTPRPFRTDTRDVRTDVPADVPSQVQQRVSPEHGRGARVAACIPCSSA
jgi:hypothetical protein